ncbi:hypothetical protein AMTRI_Chr02g262180 [Amborella trichopoda]
MMGADAYNRQQYNQHERMDTEPSSYPSYAPPYVLLSEQNRDPSLRPPPHRRNIPRYYSRTPSRGCGCCRLLCCLLCTIFIFLLIIAGFLMFLYLYLVPKLPQYSVQHFGVSRFEPNYEDLSIFTQFLVSIHAHNPNENIAIIYATNSKVSVKYLGETLCDGKLPAFYQGHVNMTVMDVVLSGTSPFGMGLQAALMDQQRTGKVPLDINVDVPVQVELSGYRMPKLTVIVRAAIVVDSLAPHKKVNIRSSRYKFNVKF